MENKLEKSKPEYGLVGKNIDYSFSRAYFSKKFIDHGLDLSYDNFDLDQISEFPNVLKQNPQLRGLNVTIPYKEQVMAYLDEINPQAKAIGAVNTIKFYANGKIEGFNTDYFGFQESIRPFLHPHHRKALLLGTGGASKAVKFALEELGLEAHYVSRKASDKFRFTYGELTPEIMGEHTVIVNCSPIGTYPNVEQSPSIPYDEITARHLLFDLVYNPPQTQFLTQGKMRGATICNGSKMLVLQAEKAWEIWNK